MSNAQRNRHTFVELIFELILAAIGYRAMQRGKNPFVAILKVIFGIPASVMFLFLVIAFIGRQVSSSSGTHAPDDRSVSEPETPVTTVEHPDESLPALTPPRRPDRRYEDPSPIQPADALYDVLQDSPVFEGPNDASSVVGTIHRGRKIHVIGTTRDFLKVKLRRGPVGFVPTEVADYAAEWMRANK